VKANQGERDFGPFKLVRRVAVGGMAEVHLARTKGVGGYDKYVAIKMIHPNFAEDEQFINMLIDEAKIAVQLNHANIAHTFDLGRVGDSYYITMEYVNGADLYKILRTASEKDVYLPFDCAAAIAQGVASGLDYAHRKRDANGTPLGIVHRDVSPQNVLVSYSGEVKIVDFGIAKAALKEQQTAAGVIKGKYYYMSPEQAWGDVVDLRSDIFSAGIVLYEMITGQMLYLEEHLHKLLEMVRKADIVPPSTIRSDCPPELERIAMQALRKNPHDRYQRAADMAVDLERFLSGYAPNFAGGKLVQLLRQTVGEPMEIAAEAPEDRSGVSSTQPLGAADLLRERHELHDENSVLFSLADLKSSQVASPSPIVPSAKPVAARVAPVVAPKVGVIPSVRKIGNTQAPPIAGAPANAVKASSTPSRPRDAGEETREIDARDAAPAARPAVAAVARGQIPAIKAVAAPRAAPVAAPAAKAVWIASATLANEPAGYASPFGSDSDDYDVDGGEQTMITGPGFVHAGAADADDAATEDRPLDETRDFDANQSDIATSAVDVSNAPPPNRTSNKAPTAASDDDDDFGNSEDSPTLAREPHAITARKPAPRAGPPQPALAANNPTPSISELRKPRPSRRTPVEGVAPLPQPPSVLQALMQSNNHAPMPSARPALEAVSHRNNPSAVSAEASRHPTSLPSMPSAAATMPTMIPAPMVANSPPVNPQPPFAIPSWPQQGNQAAPGYSQQYPLSPPVATPQPQHYAPQVQQPSATMGNMAPGYGQPQYPGNAPYNAYVNPAYPYGQQVDYSQVPSGSMQMAQYEVDELPPHLRLDQARPKMLLKIVAAVAAVAIAAIATFFIVKATRHSAPVKGSVRVDSVPSGAVVIVDGQKLPNITPLTIDNLPAGAKHDLRLELARHKPYATSIEVPSTGGLIPVTAIMTPITGILRVVSVPAGADLYVNGEFRSRTPCTISDVDMESLKQVELRLKEFSPQKVNLTWTEKGEIDLEVKMLK
jgi:serine/threonine protein kinase